MTKFILAPEDHARVSEAVAEAETRSNAEIVTVIAPGSDAYHDAGLHYAIAAVFLLLGSIASFPQMFMDWATHWFGGWGHDLTQRESLTLLLAGAIMLFLIVRYILAWMPLRMVLTPRSTKTRRVRRAAINIFRTAVEARTHGRTGILVYLSLAEHRAEIVADAAITQRVQPEAWGEAMAALISHVRQGAPGDGMVEAIRQIGSILAIHIPKNADDRDELPDRLIEL